MAKLVAIIVSMLLAGTGHGHRLASSHSRLAIVVGNNHGMSDEIELRYAHSDQESITADEILKGAEFLVCLSLLYGK